MTQEENRGIQRNISLLYIFGLAAHSLMFIFFLQYKITIMVYFNIASIILYIVLSLVFRKDRSNVWKGVSVVFSSIEVIIHQVLAVVCVGPGIGFQYFLIMIGLTLMLQSKNVVRKQIKFASCALIIIIMIAVQIYASDHAPIYELPVNIQKLLLTAVTLVSVIGIFSFSLSQWNISEHYREQIETLLGERNTKILEMQAKTIHNFADIVERRDGNTGGHIKRTSAYVKAILKALEESGSYADTITPDYARMLISAAPLHDIGKITINDSILLKKGKLTEEEYETMKTHSATGAKMLEELLGDMESEEYVRIATSVARFHHEKWNGKGYPDHLQGTEIPLCARIMSVADVFDALTSARSYKEKFSMDRAYEIMENEAGQQFDAAIIKEFVRIRPRITEICMSLSEE